MSAQQRLLKTLLWEIKNKERRRAQYKTWRIANKEKIAKRMKEWGHKNKNRKNANTMAWIKRNPDRARAIKTSAQYARRNAISRQKISKHYRKEIIAIYERRPDGMQVDHIIPLQAKNVCGLHVPWNLQYLTPSENQSKKNNICEALEV